MIYPCHCCVSLFFVSRFVVEFFLQMFDWFGILFAIISNNVTNNRYLFLFSLSCRSSSETCTEAQIFGHVGKQESCEEEQICNEEEVVKKQFDKKVIKKPAFESEKPF
jgi:hypothetical protein